MSKRTPEPRTYGKEGDLQVTITIYPPEQRDDESSEYRIDHELH